MFVVSFLRFSMRRKYDRTNIHNIFIFLSIFIMADLSKNAEKILELVESLTIVELADLVSAMEEKFGVSAAAPVAVMAGGAAGGGAAADEEKTSFDVVMTSAGAQKIAVIKVIREITGLGLAEAKALADNGGDIKKGAKKDEECIARLDTIYLSYTKKTSIWRSFLYREILLSSVNKKKRSILVFLCKSSILVTITFFPMSERIVPRIERAKKIQPSRFSRVSLWILAAAKCIISSI